MKNILINIPHIKKEDGGIYQYSVALIKILAKANLPYNFFILCFNPDQDIKDVVDKNSNFNFTRTQPPTYSKINLLWYRILNFLYRKIGLRKRITTKDLYDCIINENNINIAHTPSQGILIKPNIKSITTLHDVQELHYPEFFTSAQRAQRAVNFKEAIDNADAVIVSYDHVKKDIIKYFDKPTNQVHCVLLDMQDLWFSKIKTRDKNILDKYHLPENHLLYPASSWEHKNHINLIKAIKKLNNPDIHLICTGHPTEYYSKQIKPFIEEQGLVDRIKFIGIVTDEELFELYNTCRAVVIPTLYEAGSFPLMESILIGIPVVCSNITSLPETIGNNRFVFDPNNIDDIADKINKIWSDEKYRQENKALSKIQAIKLYHNETASKIDNIYKKILNTN